MHQTGVTSAWTANRRVVAIDPRYDVDLTGRREAHGGPTFAAINARGAHPGGVHTLFGDGSVKFLKNTISGPTCRALGTVAAGEVLSSYAY